MLISRSLGIERRRGFILHHSLNRIRFGWNCESLGNNNVIIPSSPSSFSSSFSSSSSSSNKNESLKIAVVGTPDRRYVQKSEEATSDVVKTPRKRFGVVCLLFFFSSSLKSLSLYLSLSLFTLQHINNVYHIYIYFFFLP